jgi:hypothetical protein
VKPRKLGLRWVIWVVQHHKHGVMPGIGTSAHEAWSNTLVLCETEEGVQVQVRSRDDLKAQYVREGWRARRIEIWI